MNEKLQYKAMLDIPENTASVVVKPQKKKKVKTKKTMPEDVKTELIKKVNETAVDETYETSTPEVNENVDNDVVTETNDTVIEDTFDEVIKDDAIKPIVEESTATVRPAEKKKKPKFKFTAIKVQVAIIGVLIAVIMLTNAINPNSGINTFIKSVFGTNYAESVDLREYSDFTPVFSFADENAVSGENGIVTIVHEGSIYTPVAGTISAVKIDEDGKYSVTIKHTEKFSSAISGLDFVYLGVGESATLNLPIGYAKGNNIKACFYDQNGEVITDYTVTDNSVVWEV